MKIQTRFSHCVATVSSLDARRRSRRWAWPDDASGGGAARIIATLALTGAALLACSDDKAKTPDLSNDPATVAQGKDIFRNDTFGDETQWTDTLRMHEVIAAAVDPTTALSVGLKVDAEALPAEVVQGIMAGAVDLKSPATTVTLLKLNAVVGVKGTVTTTNGVDTLTAV